MTSTNKIELETVLNLCTNECGTSDQSLPYRNYSNKHPKRIYSCEEITKRNVNFALDVSFSIQYRTTTFTVLSKVGRLI